MITVGSKVKINADVLAQNGFEQLNESEISFIKENEDTVFEVICDWNGSMSEHHSDIYRYELNAEIFKFFCFKESELILLEEDNK